MPTINETQVDVSSSRVVEVAENQWYHALGGWGYKKAKDSLSLSSLTSSLSASATASSFVQSLLSDESTPPHYIDSLYDKAYDCSAFPTIEPLHGWKWMEDEWIIDKSGIFGACDADGWMYGPSFASILQSMKTKNSSGNSSGRSSMKRHRRFLRTMICTSSTALQREKNALAVVKRQQMSLIRSISLRRDIVVDLLGFHNEFRSTMISFVSKLSNLTMTEVGALHSSIKQIERLKAFHLNRLACEKEYVDGATSLYKYIASFEADRVDLSTSRSDLKFASEDESDVKAVDSVGIGVDTGRTGIYGAESSGTRSCNNNNNNDNNSNSNNNDKDNININIDNPFSNYLLPSPLAFDLCQVLEEYDTSVANKMKSMASSISFPLLETLDALKLQLQNTITSRILSLKEFVKNARQNDKDLHSCVKQFERVNIYLDESTKSQISKLMDGMQVYDGGRAARWLLDDVNLGLSPSSSSSSNNNDPLLTNKRAVNLSVGGGDDGEANRALNCYLKYRESCQVSCSAIFRFFIKSLQLSIITLKINARMISTFESSFDSHLRQSSELWMSSGLLLNQAFNSIVSDFSDKLEKLKRLEYSSDDSTHSSSNSSNNNSYNNSNNSNINLSDDQTSIEQLSHQLIQRISHPKPLTGDLAGDHRSTSVRSLTATSTYDQLIKVIDECSTLASQVPIFKQSLLQVEVEYSFLSAYREAKGVIIDIDWHSSYLVLTLDNSAVLHILKNQTTSEPPTVSIVLDNSVKAYAAVNSSTGVIGNCIIIEFKGEKRNGSHGIKGDGGVRSSSKTRNGSMFMLFDKSPSSSDSKNNNNSNSNNNNSSNNNSNSLWDGRAGNTSESAEAVEDDEGRGGIVLYFSDPEVVQHWLSAINASHADQLSLLETQYNALSTKSDDAQQYNEPSSSDSGLDPSATIPSKTTKQYRDHSLNMVKSTVNLLHGDLSTDIKQQYMPDINTLKAQFASVK